ncbi:MAG TPA: DEAD/DEAH box helicase [Thermoanaerobaculia bacterium]|nr:DEAD/DEAH box helicase [Thermoanaerobaculia bacterium]
MSTGSASPAWEWQEGAAESFADLGLAPDIIERLEEIGWERPTPIQTEVIPHALGERDIVGLAETGSGKTAAFVLPLVQRLRGGVGARAVILSPTREIALQTEAFLRLFRTRYRRSGADRSRERLAGLESVCLIGGVRIGPQIAKLRTNPDVVVATPGRLLDHVERRTLSLDDVEELVIDEADHMLDLGFLPQIQRILARLPADRRTTMFSATMPEAIERLARRFLHEPVRVDITPVGKTAHGIEHRLYLVEPDDKKRCILQLLREEHGSTLVFIRRKVDAEWLSRVLEKEGHLVERIHSDRSQAHRVDALEGFRRGQHRILVATDIAARGIDVPGIEHIVNFDVPETVEDYVHRAGRTARGEAVGTVSSIASWLDKPIIREIERAIGQDLPRCRVEGVEPWVERNRRSENRSPLSRNVPLLRGGRRRLI